MKRAAILMAASLMAVLTVGDGALRQVAEQEIGAAVRSFELEVTRSDGGIVWLHFEVSGSDAAQASAAALRATQELLPGGTAVDLHQSADTGAARAAFASWPWLWDASELPVPVWYSPAGAPEGVTEQAIVDGLTPWSSVLSSSFGFRYMGTTDSPTGVADRILDGQNTIGWRNLDCSAGCVLGVTSKVPEAHEVDIMLNSNPAAGIGMPNTSPIDVTTVLLHEAGHLAGLEHSCVGDPRDCTEAERQAIMYFRYLGVRHDLEEDDIAGISSLYPGSKQLSAPGGLTLASTPDLNLEIQVQPGWNVTVLPEGVIAEMMQRLTCVQAVHGYGPDGWLTWDRSNAARSTLVRSDGNQAYWLYASEQCSSD